MRSRTAWEERLNGEEPVLLGGNAPDVMQDAAKGGRRVCLDKHRLAGSSLKLTILSVLPIVWVYWRNLDVEPQTSTDLLSGCDGTRQTEGMMRPATN